MRCWSGASPRPSHRPRRTRLGGPHVKRTASSCAGVIDGYYVNDDARAIVLFGYKTDAMHDDERDRPEIWRRRLRDDYIGQQALYAEAMERLYPGCTVTQRWLVGLAGHRLINVTSA